MLQAQKTLLEKNKGQLRGKSTPIQGDLAHPRARFTRGTSVEGIHTQPAGMNLSDTLGQGSRIWVIWHPSIVPMLRQYLERLDPDNNICPETMAHKNLFVSMRDMAVFMEGICRNYKELIGNMNHVMNIVIQKAHQTVHVSAGAAIQTITAPNTTSISSLWINPEQYLENMTTTRQTYAECRCPRQKATPTIMIKDILNNIKETRDAHKTKTEPKMMKTDIIKIRPSTFRIMPRRINNLFH